MTSRDLPGLREAIKDIDEEIISLISRRTDVAKEIGEKKQETNAPLKNYEVERAVYERAARFAEQHNVDTRTAKRVMSALIEESVSAQEKDRVSSSDAGDRCLIIGGEGKMGSWLTTFLRTAGHTVETVDEEGDYEELPDLEPYDFICIATPTHTMQEIYTALIAQEPQGVVADMASLKNSFIDELRAAQEVAGNVTSFHPMFGPDEKTLAEKNVIICNVGSEEANNYVASLFENTAANLETIGIEEHDEYMAYSLTLPHALNYVFGDIITHAPKPFHALNAFASTTFQNQLRTTNSVIYEDPALYREIQVGTAERQRIYDAIRHGVQKLRQRVEDAEDFKDYALDIRRHVSND